MILIIAFWGSRVQKIKSLYYFVLYTIFGSLFLLFGILFLFYTYGTTDFLILKLLYMPKFIQKFLYIFFFIGFAVKIPIFPFHLWLPEAHVEAPTIGSVILASLLLKLGAFGFLKYCVLLFSFGNFFFLKILLFICFLSLLNAGLNATVHFDFKKIIAYSSISHMNFALFGCIIMNFCGLFGFLLICFSHGFISAGLFFLSGILYDYFHTRFLFYFSGFVTIFPFLGFFFFFFLLSNTGFPGTSSFLGELSLILGIVDYNFLILIFCSFFFIFSSVYSFLLFTRIFFGGLRTRFIFFFVVNSYFELVPIFILFFYILFFGIYSYFYSNYMDYSLYYYLNLYNYFI
jgi:NADH-ubiquinone oxidoreductase chain 4